MLSKRMCIIDPYNLCDIVVILDIILTFSDFVLSLDKVGSTLDF
jgi:hypothetical protein